MPAYAFLVCGCAVEKDMFGEREILSVRVCAQHAHRHQAELDALASAIYNDPLPALPETNQFLNQVIADQIKSKKGMFAQKDKRKKAKRG